MLSKSNDVTLISHHDFYIRNWNLFIFHDVTFHPTIIKRHLHGDNINTNYVILAFDGCGTISFVFDGGIRHSTDVDFKNIANPSPIQQYPLELHKYKAIGNVTSYTSICTFT